MTNEELAAEIKAGNKEAALPLWEQTRRFIWRKAHAYYLSLTGYRGIDEEDLRQAGFLALMDAAERYENDRGASFLHYLTFHLHHHFNRAAGLQTDRSTADPVNAKISLDAPIGEDLELTRADQLATDDDGITDAEQRIYNEQLRDALEAALDQLPAKHAETIRSRYFSNLTLSEIATTEGTSLELIRQREQKALRTLARKARAKRNKLLVYIEAVSNYYQRTNFNRTHTSPTEATALRQLQMLEEFTLWEEKRKRWLEEMQPWLREIANREE